jgi:hypothetical protein
MGFIYRSLFDDIICNSFEIETISLVMYELWNEQLVFIVLRHATHVTQTSGGGHCVAPPPRLLLHFHLCHKPVLPPQCY